MQESYSSTVHPKLKGRLMGSCQSRALLLPIRYRLLYGHWALEGLWRIPGQTSGNWIFVLIKVHRSEKAILFISVGSSFSVRHLFFQRRSFHGRFSYIVNDEKWQNCCSAFTVLCLLCFWASCWKGCVRQEHGNIQIAAFLIEGKKCFEDTAYPNDYFGLDSLAFECQLHANF